MLYVTDGEEDEHSSEKLCQHVAEGHQCECHAWGRGGGTALVPVEKDITEPCGETTHFPGPQPTLPACLCLLHIFLTLLILRIYFYFSNDLFFNTTVRMISKLCNFLIFSSAEIYTLLSILNVPNVPKSFISRVKFSLQYPNPQSN